MDKTIFDKYPLSRPGYRSTPCLTPPADRRFRLSVKKVLGKLEFTTTERSGNQNRLLKLSFRPKGEIFNYIN
ncbi:MAG: hypothetical protein WA133_07735 [Syntrophales bacterium]